MTHHWNICFGFLNGMIEISILIFRILVKNIKSSYQNISNRLKILLTFIAICNISFCQGDTVSIHFRFYHSDHLGSASMDNRWCRYTYTAPTIYAVWRAICNRKNYFLRRTFHFTGKTCSPLLHYHCVNHANSCGNAIANSQGLLHAETGFSYFGA